VLLVLRALFTVFGTRNATHLEQKVVSCSSKVAGMIISWFLVWIQSFNVAFTGVISAVFLYICFVWSRCHHRSITSTILSCLFLITLCFIALLFGPGVGLSLEIGCGDLKVLETQWCHRWHM
jgi:hypothetical protein